MGKRNKNRHKKHDLRTLNKVKGRFIALGTTLNKVVNEVLNVRYEVAKRALTGERKTDEAIALKNKLIALSKGMPINDLKTE